MDVLTIESLNLLPEPATSPRVFGRIAVNRLPELGFDVVFKIQETCNINCSYCYMYNVGNIAYKTMPQQASIETCLEVARLIAHEFSVREPGSARLILHGGEPMLMKAEAMDLRLTAIDAYLRRHLSDVQYSRFLYSIQTNAMLVTPAWLKLIDKWDMQVSVSVDGPRHVHDRQRIDKKGRGTYDRVINGIGLLRSNERLKQALGALCVVDPEADGGQVYRHIVDDLGFTGFNFLLPFMTWDSYDSVKVDGVRNFYVSAFKEWKKDYIADRKVYVRIFQEAIQSFVHGRLFDQHRAVQDILYEVFVVDCDGTIMTEESLRPSFEGRFSQLNVRDVTISEIVDEPQFVEVATDTFSLSDECDGCALICSCRSGSSIGRVGMRYTSAEDILRKSVYCSAFIDLYVEVAAFVAQGGRDVSLYLNSNGNLQSLGEG